MIQVKIFSGMPMYFPTLEEEVNQWIADEGVEVIEIKTSGVGNTLAVVVVYKSVYQHTKERVRNYQSYSNEFAQERYAEVEL